MAVFRILAGYLRLPYLYHPGRGCLNVFGMSLLYRSPIWLPVKARTRSLSEYETENLSG
jgi:hypothetical protein